MEDSTPLNINTNPPLVKLITSAIYEIKYKSLIFLFIIFILMTSDVFVNVMLKKIKGATDEHGLATPYGAVIQGFMLVICYMILNFLVAQDLL